MTRIFTPVVAFVLASGSVRAQEPPSLGGAEHVPQQISPAAPVPPSPGVVQITPEKMQRIYHIRQLESILTNAVKAGASTLAYQMQMAEPSLFVTANARTRGFEIEGYGVFFDVDVPAMLQSGVFQAQARQDQLQYVESLRAAVNDEKVNPAIRRMAAFELSKMQRMLALPPPSIAAAPAAQPPPQGVVRAAETTDVTPAPTVSALPDLRDPNERYTEAIKEKLIDVMLIYGSNALKLDDKEWLVIAARATSDAPPTQLDDSASIVLRIKGEDLNALAQQKITRDEAIKRIEVKIG